MIASDKFFLNLFIFIILNNNIFSQSYNDGPITLEMKLREVQGNFASTDEAVLGVGFAPDELTFKIWGKDNLNTFPWTGGNCLQDQNFYPTIGGANSLDFNHTFASFNFPNQIVPQYLDIKIDAWEDDLPSDQLVGFCNSGTACSWNDVECCGVWVPPVYVLGILITPGFCAGISTGDDYRCDATPFYQGLNYRNGSPCQWYSHGYINGSGCNNPSSQSGAPNTDGYYKPHVETFWRYSKGTSFANSIDLGTISTNTISHFNSNECYTNYYPFSTGNDVIYSFNVTSSSGVKISLCGINGAQFDSHLYLVQDTSLPSIENNNDFCGNQSEISTSLCNPGKYYIIVDAISPQSTGIFTLTVTEDPSMNFSSTIVKENVTCANGGDGKIKATLNGNGGVPPFTFNWFDNNMTSISSTIATFNNIDSISSLDTGMYILNVIDNRNCILVDTIYLDSLETLELEVTPVDPIICSGSSVNLTVSGANTYSWIPSNTLNTNFGNIVQVTPQVSSTYSVIGTGINGCEDTLQINVGVIPGPNINVFPPSINICQGDTITCYLSGAESYSWFPNNSISTNNGDTVTIFTNSTTNYSVIGSDNSGCNSTIQIPVNVLVSPILSINTSNDTICVGDQLLLNASGASSYIWNPSNSFIINTGNSISASPIFNTLYTVVGTDTNNCSSTASKFIYVNPLPVMNINSSGDTICEGSSINLNVNGASNYIWSPALGLNTSIGANVIASPNLSTVYSVTGIDINGCSDVLSTSIYVNPKPNIILDPPFANICEGKSVNILAFGANTYSWNPTFGLSTSTGSSVTANPSSSINYSVIGTDIKGCTNTINFQFNVGITPNLSINPSNPIICKGENISLIASGANEYIWTPNLTLSSNVGTMVNANPNLTTTYTLIGTDTIGCKDTINTTVIVKELPQANIEENCGTLICNGDSAIISIDVTGNPPWNISYSNNGVFQDQIISTNNPTIIFATSSGNYTVPTISDATGCSNTGLGSLSIEVFNKPIADFDFFPQPTNELNPKVSFTNYSNFAENWIWDFGDGYINSSDFSPTHSYIQSGTYNVQLVVTNGICSDTIQKNVIIDPVYSLYIPDAFSPNDDGLNDVFLPVGSSIVSYHLRIFNRWGEEIFISDNLNYGWDGELSNNSKAEPGYYNYIIKIVDEIGTSHKRSGIVLLN